MKSMLRSMSTRERSSGLGSKVSTWSSWETTISSCLVRCSKPRSLPQTLPTYVLPSFSHCSHLVAHGRLSQKHMARLLISSNAHVSVQRCLRLARTRYMRTPSTNNKKIANCKCNCHVLLLQIQKVLLGEHCTLYAHFQVVSNST